MTLLISVLTLYVASTLAYVLFFSIQKDLMERIAFYFILSGCLLHGAVTLSTFIKEGVIPAQNLHQTLSISGFFIALMFLAIRYWLNIRILGIFAAPIVTILMIAAVQFPNTPVDSVASLKSLWLIGHIVTIFLGEASFALAFGAGVLYLIQEKAIKRKKRGYFFKRLPSLELIDQTGYFCIIVGFTTITIGLVTGMIYAKMLWGRFWAWDPKEVWSGISWFLYAVLLHERLTVGLRGRKSAILAIIGFLVILFTFLGVNLFLTGHHGQFTTW